MKQWAVFLLLATATVYALHAEEFKIPGGKMQLLEGYQHEGNRGRDTRVDIRKA